jgi:hypothetical protein
LRGYVTHFRRLRTLSAIAKSDTWIAALLSLVAGMIFYPFARIGLDPHHDGIMLKPALDVLSGQVLYRDTFSQYGPLTTYLQALALAVEPTLRSVRVLTALANAGSLFFLYLSWRVLLPRSLSLVASLMFVLYAQFYDPEFPLIPWSSVLALFFQSAAFLSVMRIIAGSVHAAWPWLLGVACASTCWCRQPVGIILTLSVGVIATALHCTGWRETPPASRSAWLKAGAAFCTVSLLFLAHLSLNGAVAAWWEQTVLWPKRWAMGYNDEIFWVNAREFIYSTKALVLLAVLLVGFLPAILRLLRPGIPPWVDFAWLLVLSGVYLTYARPFVAPAMDFFLGGWNGVVLLVIVVHAFLVIGRALWQPRDPARSLDREYYASATLGGLALGSALQIYPLPEPNHLYWSLAPGLGVFLYLCHRRLRVPALGCSLVFLLLLTPAVFNRYRWGTYTLNMPGVTLVDPPVLRGMRVKPPLAAALGKSYAIVQPVLQRYPDQPVILYGYDALYLTWFSNRENPSPYYVNWRDLMSPADRQKRLEYVFKNKPVVLLHSQGALDLQFIPADYEIVPTDALLDLRIALPRHARPKGDREAARP